MRPYNFSAGPSTMPEPVLRRIRDEFLDWQGTGCSILEASHRSPRVVALVKELEARVRSLLGVPDTHAVLFCQGGARLQFAMVPMNLLGAGTVASYIVTGTWSKSAETEAMRFARIQSAFSGNGTRTPSDEEIDVTAESSYLYYCDNETVHGVEFAGIPDSGAAGVPLVADMSSNFMSRPVDVSKFGLLYAAAQKNFGPAGLTVVVVRRDLLGLASPEVPTLLNYAVYEKTGNMPNTPAVFQLYCSNLMAAWIESEGGLAEMDARARERSRIVYEALDAHPEVYSRRVDRASRSRMNVVFHLAEDALTPIFLKEAHDVGLLNLAGHRTVGGLRASLYNAMPVSGALALAEFLHAFALRHPRRG